MISSNRIVDYGIATFNRAKLSAGHLILNGTARKFPVAIIANHHFFLLQFSSLKDHALLHSLGSLFYGFKTEFLGCDLQSSFQLDFYFLLP
jgi:hypothetical protein